MKLSHIVFTVANVECMLERGLRYDPHSAIEGINEVLLNSTSLEPRLIFH